MNRARRSQVGDRGARGRGNQRRVVVLLGCCLACVVLLSSRGHGDDWLVRRVLVPQGSLSEVVAGRGSYLTIERDKFDRLLAAQTPVDARLDSLERFSRAVFEGRLDADGALRGTGLVELGPTADDAEWLEVDPPTFWIGGGRWLEADDPTLAWQADRNASINPTPMLPAPVGGGTTADTSGQSLAAPGRPLVRPFARQVAFDARMGTSPRGKWAIERIAHFPHGHVAAWEMGD